MSGMSDKRKYHRCENTVCIVFISKDRKNWYEIDVCDISAGGLRFQSSVSYSKDDLLSFDLQVFNGLSEFNIPLQGKIVRVEGGREGNTYAVQFENVNKYHQIQLDEIIKSKERIKDAHPAFSDDGVHTFVLVPKLKRKGIRVY